MFKWLRFVSIHDAFTRRVSNSDPTMSNNDNLVISQFKPVPVPQVVLPPPQNLRFVSIHDALTSRAKNSDPTDKEEHKDGGKD